MDLSNQKQEVYAWLEELYGDEPIPEFEMNGNTIGHLHQLSLISHKRGEMVQLVVSDLQLKTDEYNAEAQRLSSVLSRLRLSTNNLSQSGVNSVRTLAKLGTLLDVKDVSDTCYLLALQTLDDEMEQVLEKSRAEVRQLEQLTAKSHSALLKCNALNKALDDVKKKTAQDQSVVEGKKNDTAFLLTKAKGYGKELSKLQMQLVDAKADKAIFHENLVKKAEMLKALEEKLAPLKAELQSYSCLPPDLSETKIKIEQQKRELAQLEKQVSECIDMSLL